jgi:2-methylcitrate dehydratase
MASRSEAPPDALLTDITDYVVKHRAGDDAVAAARLALMDALACALYALDHPECTKLLGPLVPGTIAPHGAVLPGTPFVLDPATAAFDLGSMIRWLDFNDASSGLLTTHPSDTIAGVLMLADHQSRQRLALARKPLVVRDVLEAMVKTYEIQGGLGRANDFRKFGIDQPLLTRVALAPVLTKMLGGHRDQIFNALSNAWIATTLSIVRNAPNIGTRKNWATAEASFEAVRLAYMACRGEMGYPWVLTAPELGFHDARCGGEAIRLSAPLGDEIIRQVMFKLVPAGMHGQTAAECAFRLHPAVRERLDRIERITIHAHRALTRIMDKPGALRNPADRDHCVQYIVAVGLLHGRLAPHDFEDDFAADPRIDALRAKMTIQEDERYTAEFNDPQKRSSANSVQVHFTDGSATDRVEIEYPAGHPRRREEALPLLRAKFDDSLRRRFPRQRALEVRALFEDAAWLEAMPVNEFVDAMRG